MKRCLFFALLCFLTCVLVGPVAAARTIEFETTEVTQADVALSPDGQWLVFTMLGHLFRLPVDGGTAEQLTFGPYYDTDPVFSPDGSRVAFVSDRDGSEGNVFVLELATGQITQVTHEPWSGRPTWTPDGKAIVFLHSVRGGLLWPAVVREVALGGAQSKTVSTPPRIFRSIFYLPDGRLGWTVVEFKTAPRRAITRIEVMSAQRTVSTLRTLEGIADPVIASPTGDGLYCRRVVPAGRDWLPQPEELLFLPLPNGAERQLIPLLNYRGGRPRPRRPRFAVAADNKRLYLAEAGRLWKVALPSGVREPIAFHARVKLEIQDPVAPPRWAPAALGSSARPRSVLDPRLSPDGRRLVFGAAGYLWQQPLGSGPAQRLIEGSAFEREPAFSPDGQQLAFVRSEYGKHEVQVFDLRTGKTHTVASGPSYWNVSWSPDGRRLVFVERESSPHRVVAVNVSDGREEKLTETVWWWGSRPHLSSDGRSLYFSGPPGAGTLYRLSLLEKSKPEPITQLERQLTRALVSPDGKWLAFKRNTEIWAAPLASVPVKEEDVRRLSPEGGDSFAFTPDSSAVIYAAGNRIWRDPLGGGKREELSVRIELQRPAPAPLLLRRLHVLDFESGGFGGEASLFIEQGRIRWIGSERGRPLPNDTVIVDAGGRFAIPGLFDLHVHTYMEEATQEAFLAYGVTSVRDMGAWLAWLNALADRGDAPSNPLPRYFFSGEQFEDAQPARGSLGLLIENDKEARSYVRLWKKRGAHFIKVHPPISWPLQRTVAEEARRLGLPVFGHGLSVEEITKSVTLGYAGVEHTNLADRFYDDVLQMLALAGTRWDPTLAVMGGAALLLRDEPERLADLKLQAFTPASCIHFAQTESYMRAIDTRALRGSWVEQLTAIRTAHRRGVRLQVGTDPEPGSLQCFYGSSLHWELEFFVQAGLTPLEVLRIATQEGAAAVGAEDHLGTLEPGKLADLILLDANPLEDIKNTQTIWRVIKGGWVFDPDKLRPAASTSSAPDQKGD